MQVVEMSATWSSTVPFAGCCGQRPLQRERLRVKLFYFLKERVQKISNRHRMFRERIRGWGIGIMSSCHVIYAVIPQYQRVILPFYIQNEFNVCALVPELFVNVFIQQSDIHRILLIEFQNIAVIVD
jgi:hypothetical protein